MFGRMWTAKQAGRCATRPGLLRNLNLSDIPIRPPAEDPFYSRCPKSERMPALLKNESMPTAAFQQMGFFTGDSTSATGC